MSGFIRCCSLWLDCVMFWLVISIALLSFCAVSVLLPGVSFDVVLFGLMLSCLIEVWFVLTYSDNVLSFSLVVLLLFVAVS